MRLVPAVSLAVLALLGGGLLLGLQYSGNDDSPHSGDTNADRGELRTGSPAAESLDEALGTHVRLPLLHRLSEVAGGSLNSAVIVANLAGEIEGCNCSGAAGGGLLATLALVRRLRDEVPGVLVVDGGGNVERADGQLAEGDLPPSFVREMQALIVDGAYRDGVLQLREANVAIGELSLAKKGEFLTVVHWLDSGDTSSNLKNRSLAVQLALVRDAAGENPGVSLSDVLQGAFVVEFPWVSVDHWKLEPDLVALRRRIITEIAEAVGTESDEALVEDCAPCHQAAIDGWTARGTHSQAFSTLKRSARYAHRNATCIPCHTTALTQDQMLERPIRVPERQQGVQCGACHAAETSSTSTCSKRMTLPAISLCGRCHTPGRNGSLQANGESLGRLVGCTN